MEKKSAFIHSATAYPEKKKEHANSCKLLHCLQEIKVGITNTFLQLQNQYQIHFPSEPLFFQRLSYLTENYAHFEKRKEIMEEIETVPEINDFSEMKDLKARLLHDDATIMKIQDTLIEEHKNLVGFVLEKFKRNILVKNKTDIYEDLQQAGFIGLMVAINKYDFSKNCEFSTYAVWWIRQKVQRLIEKYGRPISIPTGKKEDLDIIQKAQRQLSEEYKKNSHMIASIVKTMQLHPNVKKRMTSHAIATILEIQQTVFESLDEAVGYDKESVRAEFIPSREIPPGHEKSNKELIEVLSAIPQLTDMGLQVIVGYYGLKDGQNLSYYDLGKQYGKSHEHIRTIHLKELEKIKNAAKNDPLLDRDLRSFI